MTRSLARSADLLLQRERLCVTRGANRAHVQIGHTSELARRLHSRRVTVKTIAIHAGLFVAACVTTGIQGGPYFAATLMGILACHEAGHYFLGRYHGVPVSLPYFIPLPPGISLGTLGAVIKMDREIPDRNKLFDV